MSACVKSPSCPFGIRPSTRRATSFLKAGEERLSPLHRSLANTRSTFPSTAAAGSPKAMEATAPAV